MASDGRYYAPDPAPYPYPYYDPAFRPPPPQRPPSQPPPPPPQYAPPPGYAYPPPTYAPAPGWPPDWPHYPPAYLPPAAPPPPDAYARPDGDPRYAPRPDEQRAGASGAGAKARKPREGDPPPPQQQQQQQQGPPQQGPPPAALPAPPPPQPPPPPAALGPPLLDFTKLVESYRVILDSASALAAGSAPPALDAVDRMLQAAAYGFQALDAAAKLPPPPASPQREHEHDQPVALPQEEPPVEGQTCLGCGATSTPEWRRGPMGPRTLCNACGLVYAKLIKKRNRGEFPRQRPQAKPGGPAVDESAPGSSADGGSDDESYGSHGDAYGQ